MTGLFLLGLMLVILAMILGIVYGGRSIKQRFRKAQ